MQEKVNQSEFESLSQPVIVVEVPIQTEKPKNEITQSQNLSANAETIQNQNTGLNLAEKLSFGVIAALIFIAVLKLYQNHKSEKIIKFKKRPKQVNNELQIIRPEFLKESAKEKAHREKQRRKLKENGKI